MSSPGLRDAFGRAASRWRPSGLIHGDLRWSNVLAASDGRDSRVWLVDWELACLGDPAWDVGSVIGDLVTAPLAAPTLGSSYDPTTPTSRFLAAYRSELPAARPSEFAAFVERSAAFAGIRLVQTLIEYGYAGAAELNAVEPFLRPWIDLFLSDVGSIASWLAAGEMQISRGIS
jgi:aminoglycoside phosphotransferase (APT) family kinase protein